MPVVLHPRVYGYGSLTVGFSLCPPEDAIPFPFDYDTAGINELATICSLYKEQPVPMKIYSHANAFSMTQYTSPSSGTVTWTTLAAGGQTLSTDPRSGYTPRMFCYHSVGDTSIFEAPIENWNATIEVKKNVGSACDWFSSQTIRRPRMSCRMATSMAPSRSRPTPAATSSTPRSIRTPSGSTSCTTPASRTTSPSCSSPFPTRAPASPNLAWPAIRRRRRHVAGRRRRQRDPDRSEVPGYGTPIVCCASFNPPPWSSRPTT